MKKGQVRTFQRPRRKQGKLIHENILQQVTVEQNHAGGFYSYLEVHFVHAMIFENSTYIRQSASFPQMHGRDALA